MRCRCQWPIRPRRTGCRSGCAPDPRADHDAAQGSGFLDRLAAGRLPREAYADLAAQHWFIYESLEQAAAGDGRRSGGRRRSCCPELIRLPALPADLAFLVGPDWRRRIAALPATAAYCARLREVAFDRPSAFVAHHYTRYLGDLSGGQYLGPAIAQAYGLDGAATGSSSSTGSGRGRSGTRYRDLLDRISWPRAEEDAFLAEVVRGVPAEHRGAGRAEGALGMTEPTRSRRRWWRRSPGT